MPGDTSKPAHVVYLINSDLGFTGCEVEFLVQLDVSGNITGLLDIHVCRCDVCPLVGEGDPQVDNPVYPGQEVSRQFQSGELTRRF